jgi:ATP-dependent RNA helicase RhlE
VPFSNLKLHPDLVRATKELGFTRPTPIQADAIPPGLAGRDVLAAAATGSGKTAAFLLPIAHQLIAKPRGKTRALVLVPTRELASQVLGDLNDLAVHTPISGAIVIGGVGMGPQEHALRTGTDVIIATPGRLLDHMRAQYARFDALEHLVLDEADRMLDMGFLPEIRKIVRQLPQKRQTFFFSATMPPPIAELTREMCKDPVRIQIERQAAPAAGITQAIYPVPQELKASLLVTLIKRGELQDTLVFTRTKHRANRLAEQLARQGIHAERIHGNRSQTQRTAALEGFKSGKFQVLVATDIAARGIDISELGHVVNFDVPLAPEDYIHRVGRTARAGATGDAFTFVAPDEEGDLRAIERAVGKRLPRVTVPDFDYAQRAASLEIPLAERIREIRTRKAEERRRADANRQRRGGHGGAHSPDHRGGAGPRHGHGQGPRHGQGQGQGQGRGHGSSQGQGSSSGSSGSQGGGQGSGNDGQPSSAGPRPAGRTRRFRPGRRRA